jgi:hypothetical protein
VPASPRPTDPDPLPSGVPAPDELARRTTALLAAHVPLSLLLDLADPAGPRSDELLRTEPGAADWLPRD